MNVEPFYWKGKRFRIMDQRLLPGRVTHLTCRTDRDVAAAIRQMAVRGAPAIGCCAAFGMVLGVSGNTPGARESSLRRSADLLKRARPTAVNLAWAVNQMLDLGIRNRREKTDALRETLLNHALKLQKEDVEINRALGGHGAALFGSGSVVLTHCNAGALATAGYGTALGVVRSLHTAGKLDRVLVDETRPFLQGARLTAWELDRENIPHDLITDNMAAHLMARERIDGIVVGCDRVAANGDTANKIGTYAVAILARFHKIPFYVAMPLSTLDLSLKTGDAIPIEDRSSAEVVRMGSTRIAPKRTRARHPAFDVTPASLITAFITEKGIVEPPFKRQLRRIAEDPVP